MQPRAKFLVIEGLMKSRSMTMSTRRITRVALIAVVFATAIARSSATNAPHLIPRPARFSDLNYLPVLSDFDGDRRLDQAELHLAGTHHCIRVRFGNTRETHLDFGTRPHSSGVLLVRDVNQDNRPDLIWVYRSRSESAVIWINNGSGRFAKSGDGSSYVTVDSLFGDRDYAETGSLENEEIGLAPARPPSEFPQVTSLEDESLRAVMIPGGELRRDLGLYLSYLRERGPPQTF